MIRPALAAALVLASTPFVIACGRVGFSEQEVDAGVETDAAIDAPAEAMPDGAAMVLVFVIEQPVHHFGDTVGGTPNTPEPNNWSKSFVVNVGCTAATYDLDWHPPWGPNMATPPSIRLNNIDLGSVLAAFDAAQCVGGDCNPMVVTHATFDATDKLVVGTNTIAITSTAPGDDFFIGGQEIRCTQ